LDVDFSPTLLPARAYVLHTFALTFFIASIALWMVGIETKGRVLEQITGAEKPA
jgi:hypothetical protein